MASCDFCHEKPLTIKCGGCHEIRYCSEQCAAGHWTAGHRLEHQLVALSLNTPVDEHTTLYDVVTEGNNNLLEYLSTDGPRLTPLPQSDGSVLQNGGFIARGDDGGYVFNVARPGHRNALKLAVVSHNTQAVRMMHEGDLHAYLASHLEWELGQRLDKDKISAIYMPIIRPVERWTVIGTVRNLIGSRLEMRREFAASPAFVDALRDKGLVVDEELLISGQEIEFIELDLNSQITRTGERSRLALIAQSVCLVAMLQSHGLVHNDIHGGNLRLRRINLMVDDLGYTVAGVGTVYVHTERLDAQHKYMAVLADFGRSNIDYSEDVDATQRYGAASLGNVRVYEVDEAKLQGILHWPNVWNPGYDLYSLGIQLYYNSVSLYQRQQLSREMLILLRACLPSQVQMRQLTQDVTTATGSNAIVAVLDAMVRAANEATFANGSDVLKRMQAETLRDKAKGIFPSNFHYIPWNPRYLPTVANTLAVLSSIGLLRGDGTGRTAPTSNYVVMRWK